MRRWWAAIVAAGLTCHLVAEMVQDALSWLVERSLDWKPRAGVSRSRDEEILASWYLRQSG